MTRLRKLAPMAIPGIEPGGADVPIPIVKSVDPSTLLVDETYQRNLSERSVKLIRKIISDFDWCRFKPPVVTKTKDGLHVLDGQHTAIAAATHPKIKTIPVMLVDAPEIADRARAFLGHNRDRIQVTPTQMFAAAVAAGDPDAVTVSQVCARAGIVVLKNPPGAGAFKPRDTMAVACITSLVGRLGALLARQYLDILAKANCAPIGQAHIKAVEMLMKEVEYAGQISPEDLTTTIIATRDKAEREAKVFAAAHDVPFWKALGIYWFKERPRGRRRAA
jgi:hypothetical protein